MAKAKTNKQIAEEYHDKFPDAQTRALARKIYKDHPIRFASLNSAYKSIATVRGQNGTAYNKQRLATRPTKGTPSLLACPPTMAEEWTPFVLPKPMRLLVLSDAHFPYHCPEAITAAVDYAKEHHNPNGLLLNGDWADFYAISRWDRDPAKRNFVSELNRVEESLVWVKSQFPKAKRYYKLGNHEERYNTFIWNKAPELWGIPGCRFEDITNLAKHGFGVIADHRPVMAGELPILHGHELQKGIAAPVNPARGAWLRTKHTALVGHSHTTSGHTEPNMWHSETTTWSTGCLCDLRPEYARINKWNHGFAFVDIDKSGEFEVHNYKIARKGWKVRLA